MGCIGHKIIVEGIDGAGKTTYINKLIKENPEMNYKVVHCTRHTDNNYGYFLKLLLSKDNIIFDRFCYGQFVYQSSEDRIKKDWLTVEELFKIERIIKDMNFKVVYVRSSIKNCLYNCKKDCEDSYYTEDYLTYLETLFSGLFFNISTLDKNNFELYNNDYEIEENSQSVSEKDFDYSSLPKVVAIDFDGTLVTGAKFPEIGTLNKYLVNELLNGKYKDYKRILFTHRTGQALIDACNFCADNGLYFDAVNDDIPEVKEALGRTGTPENGRKPWFDIIIDDKSDLDVIGLNNPV